MYREMGREKEGERDREEGESKKEGRNLKVYLERNVERGKERKRIYRRGKEGDRGKREEGRTKEG